jgi:hypothetical protein
MEIKPLKKAIYDRAMELGVESIELNFSGGNDEGHLNITVNPESLLGVAGLEGDIHNWVWQVYNYTGAGDGYEYGDNIVYDLREGKTSHTSWHTAVDYDSPTTGELEITDPATTAHSTAKGSVKTIPLQEAYALLENASAVIVDDHVLVYPGLSGLEGDDANEFLYLRWEDEGLGYRLTFNEEFNREVDIVGSSLFLYDTDASADDSATQITLLVPQELT